MRTLLQIECSNKTYCICLNNIENLYLPVQTKLYNIAHINTNIAYYYSTCMYVVTSSMTHAHNVDISSGSAFTLAAVLA